MISKKTQSRRVNVVKWSASHKNHKLLDPTPPVTQVSQDFENALPLPKVGELYRLLTRDDEYEINCVSVRPLAKRLD